MKFARLVLANIVRKKARLLLTIGSFAVALFLFALLGVVDSAFSNVGGVASASRLIVTNRTSIINLIPLSYRDEILRVPGVTAVAHYNWFGGVYQDPKNFFPQFVIDPKNQRKVYPELAVPNAEWQAFLNDRQGAIVGAVTMKRFGWKLGDRVPIKSTLYGLNNQAVDFNIDGVYHGTQPHADETQFWFRWDYFEELVPPGIKGQVGWYVLRIANPSDAPRVAQTIDAMYLNSPYPTRTETESAYAAGWVQQFGNIRFLILAIGSVVFFTLLLVTGNTMAIAVRERTPELAILKAIGFSDRTVLGLVLAESLLIALAGCIGLGLAAVVIPGLSAGLGSMLPPLQVSPRLLGNGVVAALAVGFASAILPGLGAMRLRVVNALRRV